MTQSRDTTRRSVLRHGLAAGALLLTGAAGTALGASTARSRFRDEDDNGIPDEGEVVTGTYTSVYAYDANGDYYWDLGDGRVLGTVDSIDDLDASTLTVCDYQVQYRGAFENDAFLDSGWIKNDIVCRGHGIRGADTYNYLIVHETDPRYTGDGPAVWGNWEYHVSTQDHFGNVLVRPQSPPGQS